MSAALILISSLISFCLKHSSATSLLEKLSHIEWNKEAVSWLGWALFFTWHVTVKPRISKKQLSFSKLLHGTVTANSWMNPSTNWKENVKNYKQVHAVLIKKLFWLVKKVAFDTKKTSLKNSKIIWLRAGWLHCVQVYIISYH